MLNEFVFRSEVTFMYFTVVSRGFSFLVVYLYCGINMKWCLVFGCKNKGNIDGVHYYRLTKRRFASWSQALNRDPTQEFLSEDNVVCSNHFGPEDFEVKGNKLCLRDNAIPSYNIGAGGLGVSKCLLPLFTSQTPDECADMPSTSKKTQSDEEMAKVLVAVEEDSAPFVIPSTSSVAGSSVSSSSHEEMSRKRQRVSTTTPVASSSSDSQGLRGSAKKRRKYLRMMHSYNISPRKLKRSYDELLSHQSMLKKKLKMAERRTTRLTKKIKHLNEVTRALRQRKMLSENAADCLEKSFYGMPLALMKRMLVNARGKVSRIQYPPELRSFAMTLQFYSSKAYEYVRQTFSLALPSQSVIRQWLSNVECTPGFSEPAFDSLKAKADAAPYLETENEDATEKKREPIFCSFMLDEMHIKKHVEFFGNRTWGYEDLGTGIRNDQLRCATQVLVFMVVAMKAHWKLPIAYFLIQSMSASEKANVVNEALTKLHECNIKITSVTCDGPSLHFAMATALGAHIQDLDNLDPSFAHPVDNSPVFIVFDNCHMLKLLRNFWMEYGQFLNPDDEIIDFAYVKALFELQEKEGLRFGTRLNKRHIEEWQKQKMKVKLAVQVLSRSVADALQFLKDDIKHPQFEGAGPTIQFIRLVDQVFDLLNSRNPVALGFKGPLIPKTEETWRPLLESAVIFFKHCKNMSGAYMHSTRNRTPFRGYIITITSMLQMYNYYIKVEKPLLRYLLTYKFSQDHLELFFCSVRSRNGSNNNPTALQFYRTYKRLLLHHDIKNMTGNCAAQDATNILLTTASSSKTSRENVLSVDDMALIRKYELDVSEIISDHDYQMPISPPLTAITDNVVGYIGGFVVRIVRRHIKCQICLYELVNQENCSFVNSHCFLINRKDLGGLIKPSIDLINILKIVEIEIRKLMNLMDNKLPPELNFFRVFCDSLSINIFSRGTFFINLQKHCLDYSMYEQHHIKKLISAIVTAYARVRFYNLAKKYTDTQHARLVRKDLSKYIIFLGQ